MTKLERNKCEKLLQEAIKQKEFSEECWNAYNKFVREENAVDAEIKLRQFENSNGYAQGIYRALAVLGIDGEGMRQLSELL